MKFESAFGLGEIVLTKQHTRESRIFMDSILKVIAIQFSLDDGIFYACRDAERGGILYYTESELIGDPDFNQETGKYLEEEMQ